jgi:hypothetical protein
VVSFWEERRVELSKDCISGAVKAEKAGEARSSEVTSSCSGDGSSTGTGVLDSEGAGGDSAGTGVGAGT